MSSNSEDFKSVSPQDGQVVEWCCRKDPSLWEELTGMQIEDHSGATGEVVDVTYGTNDLTLLVRMLDDHGNHKTKLFLGSQFFSHFALKEIPKVITDREDLMQSFYAEAARDDLAQLMSSFGMDPAKVPESTSPLHGILLELNAEKTLGEDAIKWLESKRIHVLLAINYERMYSRDGDPWDGAKACSKYRKTDQVAKAVQLRLPSKDCNSKATAAFFTCRAAAHADLGNLDSAKKCGLHAHLMTPNNDYTLNTLGRIYYLLGEPETGDQYFEQVNGQSDVERQDRTRKESIAKLDQRLREKTLRHLCNKDPQRYEWACNKLNRTGRY